MNIFTFVQENAVVYGVKILVAEAKVMLGVWVNSGDYGSVNQSIQQKVLKEVA